MVLINFMVTQFGKTKCTKSIILNGPSIDKVTNENIAFIAIIVISIFLFTNKFQSIKLE